MSRARPSGHAARAARYLTLAPAKVNLFLAVGPRRSDGYHDLVTLFDAVSLADEVSVIIRPAPAGHWVHLVRSRPTATSPRRLPRDLDNLAGRAARDFTEAMARAGRARGPDVVEVRVTKRIPVAAGLGGGSSDAAAVLLALQAHYGHPLSGSDLLEVAAGLGSDVPFFLEGGRAVGRGRGEALAPVEPERALPVVLGLPHFPLRTPDVYREFDRLASPGPGRATGPVLGSALWERREADLRSLLEVLSRGGPADIARHLRNDLEPAALSLRPEVGDILRVLGEAGSAGTFVSGSGPAVFGLAGSAEEAASIARRAAALLPPPLAGQVWFMPTTSGVIPRLPARNRTHRSRGGGAGRPAAKPVESRSRPAGHASRRDGTEDPM